MVSDVTLEDVRRVKEQTSVQEARPLSSDNDVRTRRWRGGKDRTRGSCSLSDGPGKGLGVTRRASTHRWDGAACSADINHPLPDLRASGYEPFFRTNGTPHLAP